jgi:hypothetical protein
VSAHRCGLPDLAYAELGVDGALFQVTAIDPGRRSVMSAAIVSSWSMAACTCASGTRAERPQRAF